MLVEVSEDPECVCESAGLREEVEDEPEVLPLLVEVHVEAHLRRLVALGGERGRVGRGLHVRVAQQVERVHGYAATATTTG